MSTFNTIRTAITGLVAQQKAMEVVGHNVANVNTIGYHRQEAVLAAQPPYPSAGSTMSPVGGQYGTGVDVIAVRRVQDGYLQSQSNIIEGELGRWTLAQQSLTQVESIIAPGENLDLSSALDRFFGAWQTLSTHPEELASRLGVRSEGENLANTLNETVKQLDLMSSQMDLSLSDRVDRINLLADKLGELNKQIGMAKGEGRNPNDLMDQREQVLSELATIAGVTSRSNDEVGSITTLGGRSLVQGGIVNHLKIVNGVGGVQITWEADGQAANISTGEVAGLMMVRDTLIPDYKLQLDNIAFALSTAVNNIHVTGVTAGGAPAGTFFTGDTAGSIHVSDDIKADPYNVSSTRLVNSPGDGTLAGEIFLLNRTALIGSQTLNQSAQSIIGQVGNAVKSVSTNVDANKALKQQADIRKQTVSGVSIDEEMSNLLIYQRAYDASARVLRTADEMLQTLLRTFGS